MQSIKKQQEQQPEKNGKSIKNSMTTGCWRTKKDEIYVLLLNELTAN